jgi:hypothetical protein
MDEKKRPCGRFGHVCAEKRLDTGTPSGRWLAGTLLMGVLLG